MNGGHQNGWPPLHELTTDLRPVNNLAIEPTTHVIKRVPAGREPIRCSALFHGAHRAITEAELHDLMLAAEIPPPLAICAATGWQVPSSGHRTSSGPRRDKVAGANINAA